MFAEPGRDVLDLFCGRLEAPGIRVAAARDDVDDCAELRQVLESCAGVGERVANLGEVYGSVLALRAEGAGCEGAVEVYCDFKSVRSYHLN